MAKEAASLGVDFGVSRLGAVQVRLVDGRTEIASAASFCLEQDGMLDEKELYQAFAGWLKENKLARASAVCGLPAHLAHSAVSFFPASHSEEDVEKIISFQTRQLYGLTDEAFCSASQFLPNGGDGTRSVLLSVCKARVAEQYCGIMEKMDLETQALSDNAQALVNAFAFLHPDVGLDGAVNVLLDIGQEDSTYVLMNGKAVAAIGTFPFGGAQFTTRLARYWGCDEKTAETRKLDGTGDWRDGNSAGNRAIREYAEELRPCVEPLAEGSGNGPHLARPCALWVTGGGALFPNLERELNRSLGLPVTVFGVPASMLGNLSEGMACPDGFDCQPQLTTAFGLALQGLPGPWLNLSLLPERIRWQQRKMREFPYLAGAAALVVFTVAVASCVGLLELRQNILDQLHLKANLEACMNLAPKLERAYRSLVYHQEKLLPVVEYGRRFRRYSDALNSCSEVLACADAEPTIFGFYLADEFTFAAGFPSVRRGKAETAPGKLETGVSVFAAPGASPAETDSAVLISDFPLLKSVFLGSMGEAGDASYQVVKNIQTRFHEGSAFSNVDDYIDSVRLDGKELIFRQWTDFFEKQADKLEQSRALFLLKMPFAETLTVNGQDLPRIGRTAAALERNPENQKAAASPSAQSENAAQEEHRDQGK